LRAFSGNSSARTGQATGEKAAWFILVGPYGVSEPSPTASIIIRFFEAKVKNGECSSCATAQQTAERIASDIIDTGTTRELETAAM
jgi:hypothetical protein